MDSIIKGKNILVTGGTGSIGKEIVKQVLKQNAAKVIVFSRDEMKQFIIRKELQDSRLQTVVGDVRDIGSLERMFRQHQVDIIFHAAAMKHVVMCEEFPTEAVNTNIRGTQNVIDTALEYEVPRTVTISTDKASYPVNVMGAAKFIAEKITINGNSLSNGRLAFSCVRFGNVASSRGSVIPIFVNNLLTHQPINVTDPRATRFIMEIPDAVLTITRAAQYMIGGEVFILKMKAFTLEKLVEVTVNRIAPRMNICSDFIKVNTVGLISGEKLHEDLVNEQESSRLFEIENMYVVLPAHARFDQYRSLRKSSLNGLSSSQADLLSDEEMEDIIVKYLRTINVPVNDDKVPALVSNSDTLSY